MSLGKGADEGLTSSFEDGVRLRGLRPGLHGDFPPEGTRIARGAIRPSVSPPAIRKFTNVGRTAAASASDASAEELRRRGLRLFDDGRLRLRLFEGRGGVCCRSRLTPLGLANAPTRRRRLGHEGRQGV
jgi:hypothetical protein